MIDIDISKSKYFKSLMSIDLLSYDTKQVYYYYNKTWRTISYHNNQEGIAKTLFTNTTNKEEYVFVGENKKHLIGFFDTYVFDNQNKLKHRIPFYCMINGFAVFDNCTYFFASRNNNIVLYKDDKIIQNYQSNEINFRAAYAFRPSKNFISFVMDDDSTVVEFHYDPQKNIIEKKKFIDYDLGYLSYSNDKHLYCIISDEKGFHHLIVKSRVNNRLVITKTYDLQMYFPKENKSPLRFFEGEPNFRIIEIDSKIYLLYLDKKRLRMFQIE